MHNGPAGAPTLSTSEESTASVKAQGVKDLRLSVTELKESMAYGEARTAFELADPRSCWSSMSVDLLPVRLSVTRPRRSVDLWLCDHATLPDRGQRG